MKKLILLIILLSSQILIGKLNAYQFEKFLFNESEYSDFNRHYDIGIQLKYLSGIGFSGNLQVIERMFMTGSASWLFSIMDFSIGSGYSLSKYFDLMGKLNLISVNTGSNQILLFPEFTTRLKISKSFFIEAGAIVPFSSENRKTLMEYLNIPFIVNAGLVFVIYQK